MEVNNHKPHEYHMIVRLIDNKPVLVIPRSVHHSPSEPNNPTLKISDHHQKHNLETTTAISSSQKLRTEVKIQKESLSELPEEKNDNNGIRSAPQNMKKMDPQHLQFKQKPGKRSLVDELLNLINQNEDSQHREGHKNLLEKLEWVETNSFHQGESYDFDDNQSEIIELTEEERDFFTNFVYQNPAENNYREEEPFIALQLIPSGITPQKNLENDHLPENKTKLIRNFFRSKSSMIKDDRTCCNSQTFLEEQLKKGKQKLDVSIEIPQDSIPL